MEHSIESLQFYRMYVTIRYGIHILSVFEDTLVSPSFIEGGDLVIV